MPVPFNKNYTFIFHLGKKAMDLSSDQLAVALTDTDPTASVDVYSDISNPIASSYFVGTNPYYITTGSWAQVAGQTKLILNVLQLVATGSGLVPNFRYAVVYDTVSNEVIGWFDVAQEVSLSRTNSDNFILNFDQVNGLIQIY